jgi:hypothetical protein
MSLKRNKTIDRRSFLAGAAAASAGAALFCSGAGLTGLTSLFSATAARAAGPAPQPLPPSRPFNIVTLGDSIMWGQGLPESMKFRNIVAQWILGMYQGTRSVNSVPTRAHSGAKILVDPGERDDVTGLPGEIPSHWPSITKQLALTLGDLRQSGIDPRSIDLVLLDGGINDVGLPQLLNPTISTGHINTLINQKCVQHMAGLLPQVINAFRNAAIIVTGYYPIASSDSDMVALLGLSTAAINDFAVGVAGVEAGVTALVNGALFEAPMIKNQLVKISTQWNDTAHAGLSNLINQLNATNSFTFAGPAGKPRVVPRIGLAWPYFQSANCYAASQTYLWNLLQFGSDEIRGLTGTHAESPDTPNQIAYTRAQACEHANRPSGLCVDASMGHPNQAGAQAYTNSVISLLQQYPQWAGLRELNATAIPSTVRPNALSRITIQVVDLYNGQPVPNAMVHLGNAVVPAGQPFQYTFHCTAPRSTPRPTRPNTITERPDYPPPSLMVSAPGYLSANVEFDLAGVSPGSESCR